MNKRITSLLLCFVMVFTMLAAAVPALAMSTEAPITVTIDPDKTTASPGDTITYTVNVGPVKRLQSVNFTLVIPEGLTYVSGKEVDGLKALLGADKAEYTDSTKTMVVSGGGSYNSDGTTALMQFSCTVNAGTEGTTLKITFEGDEDFSDDEYETYYTTYDFDSSKVTVTAAPVSVTGVTIDETLSVNTGEKKTPSYTVAPAEATNKTVSFTSNNTAVATVNATTGEVTGVSKGTAIITITTADGNFTDTCTVTVSCSHTNKTPVAEKASTCKEQGWDAYSKCDDCGQLFDKDGNEIDAVPTRSLAAHTAQHHDRVEPTHAAAGNIEYWTCSVCNKYFRDAACIAEITQEQTVLNKIEHSFGSDWKSNADQHWHECSCGEKNAIANHTFEWKTDTAATEDATGLKHEECTDCHYKRNENTVIPKLEHTHAWQETPAKASTCTEQGNNQYFYCTKCEKYFKADKVTETTVAAETLPLASHTESGWKSDANGHWKECTKCGAITTTKVAHTPDHTGNATEEYAIKCSVCDYVIEAQLAPRTPVTSIAATITAPALGATPDYHPVYASTPENGVEIDEITWFKIAAADFTGTDEDDWYEMETDETFTTGYYYSVDMFFNPNDGYKLTESTTGTVNGKPHDSTYGNVFDEEFSNYGAYLCGLFEPLVPEYTIDLPFSLAVKLTGDKKPAKETFKFEIYDLGCEDAEFEILNDVLTVENLEFDENGVVFVDGIIKIKVTGEDQLCNLTEGFSVRMVKGSTKGWTYASEQWHIEPFFENDALDIVIAVKEIVDGEISEEYANGMSFAVSYEAVTEPTDPTESSEPTDPQPEEPADPTESSEPTKPATPETGANSNMFLWIALLFVSGCGIFGATIYGKKKKENAE